MHSAQLAQYVDQYRVTLHCAGRYEEACVASEEAAAIQQALCAKNKDPKRQEELTTYTYGYRVSLHSLGKLDEAYAAKGDVVKLARQQYDRDQKAHREALAHCLEQYGITLHQEGRINEACDAKADAANPHA